VVTLPSAKNHRVAVVAAVIVAIGSCAFAVSRFTRAPSAVSGGASTGDGERIIDRARQMETRAANTATRVDPRVVAIAEPSGSSAAGGDAVAALRRGLESEDEATRIAAVEAVVSSTNVEALGVLEAFDLKRDPEAAPTVIHAVALLGASADGKKRDDAAATLAGWLDGEMKREGPDAPGNVSNLVEALGNVGGPDAVDALTRALDGQSLPLYVETLAVMKLGELGDPNARGAVERFAQRVAALPPAEGLDEELRVEAASAAETTLARI